MLATGRLQRRAPQGGLHGIAMPQARRAWFPVNGRIGLKGSLRKSETSMTKGFRRFRCVKQHNRWRCTLART